MKVPLVYENKELNADLCPRHEAQLTYMKLSKAPKGIIINFNCHNIFKEGQKTFVNEYFKLLPKF
ncbi:GxxExxY protein [Flavobacterium sp. W22_SRS_FK3]|uniref:GxxExxY protein n=1 Tax=Flavobacterium sp. W22_SRS_FK3 TaxID=3240275 RepID=UPI003F8E4855